VSGAASGWYAVLAGFTFAVAAYVGLRMSAMLCRTIEPFPDGPRPGNTPGLALIFGAFAVGYAVAVRGAGLPALLIILVLTASLVAAWASDVKCGIVPDSFTVVPLCGVLLVTVIEGDVTPALSAAVAFVPFAIAALVSKGRGMGWGDVKLVALGAAVLGLQASMFAFGAACVIASAVAFARGRGKEPIALAPYLAGASAAALVVPLFLK
jgi:prepilin signal peptidase PulO-like enzyme (type II secretory pathway)